MLNFLRNVIRISGDSGRIQRPILEKWRTRSKKYTKYETRNMKDITECQQEEIEAKEIKFEENWEKLSGNAFPFLTHYFLLLKNVYCNMLSFNYSLHDFYIIIQIICMELGISAIPGFRSIVSLTTLWHYDIMTLWHYVIVHLNEELDAFLPEQRKCIQAFWNMLESRKSRKSTWCFKRGR